MASDRLLELAFQYKKTKLWTRMFDNQLFAVKLSGGRTGYINIMGMLGEHNAVALYRGDEELRCFFILSSEEDDYMEINDYNLSLMNNACLQAAFEKKEFIEEDELDEVLDYAKAHKIRISGNDRFPYPNFTRYMRGGEFGRVESEEDEQDLITALEAAIAIGNDPSVKKNKYDKFPEIRETSDTIPLVEVTGDGYVVSEMKLPEIPPYMPPEGGNYDKEAAKRIMQLPREGSMHAGIMILPSPVWQEETNSYVMPVFLSVYDEYKDQMLPVKPSVRYETYPEQLLNNFMYSLEKTDTCPEIILTDDEYTEALLTDWCEDLGIDLEVMPYLPELHEQKEDINQSLTMPHDMENEYPDYLYGDENPDVAEMDNMLDIIIEKLQGDTEFDGPELAATSILFEMLQEADGLADMFPQATLDKIAEVSSLLDKKGRESSARDRAKSSGRSSNKTSKSKGGSKSSKKGSSKNRHKQQTVTLSVSLMKGCYRHIQLADTDTLGDLSCCILKAFDFEDDHLHAFFMDNRLWSSNDSYFSREARDPFSGVSEDTELYRTGITEGQKFKYLFDFGDEWVFQCKVLRIEDKKAAAPAIVRSVGQAPQQYQDWDDFEDEYDDEDDE